jgi:hypothetical protein
MNIFIETFNNFIEDLYYPDYRYSHTHRNRRADDSFRILFFPLFLIYKVLNKN